MRIKTANAVLEYGEATIGFIRKLSPLIWLDYGEDIKKIEKARDEMCRLMKEDLEAMKGENK